MIVCILTIALWPVAIADVEPAPEQEPAAGIIDNIRERRKDKPIIPRPIENAKEATKNLAGVAFWSAVAFGSACVGLPLLLVVLALVRRPKIVVYREEKQ